MTTNRTNASAPQGLGQPNPAVRRTRVLRGAGAVAAVGAAAAGILVATSGASSAAPATNATANLAAAHLVAQPGAAAPAKPGSRCDDGKWTGSGGSVQGRPEDFAAGETGRTYVWHDENGWHLRTSDATAEPHHYSGTITASAGAHLTDVTKVKFEKDDHLSVDDHNVLHYSFTTFQGIDGVDFHVSACDGARSHETLAFHLQKNGEDDKPANVVIGKEQHHPEADPFTVRRSV